LRKGSRGTDKEVVVKKIFLSFWMLLLMIGGIVFAQELPRLAVVEFDTNINIPKANRDSVTVRNQVESQLVATRQYQVITRTDIDRLLENQQIQVSSISSSENIRKLQLQNISYIVTGSINAMDNDYLITVKMLDVSTGQFSHSADIFTGSASRDLYNGVTQLISAFTAGMTSQDGQVAQVSRPGIVTYKIGDTGPGGGIVFLVEGNAGMEVSRLLGNYGSDEAINTAKNYRGGGFSDWHLPTDLELNFIYENLQKARVVNLGDVRYWCWQPDSNVIMGIQDFRDGRQERDPDYRAYAVRAVRSF
jgi:TolB-like protein